MHEIKFRAWEKEMKRMFTFEELDNATGGLVKIGNKALKEEFGENMKLNPGGLFIPTKDENMILMQYTGLKDKNGKEIYEGDIVQILGGEYEQGFYEWNKRVQIKDLIYDGYNLMMTISQIGNEGVEVIGNIYDNPELLKEE